MVRCYYKNDNDPNLIRSINSGVCMGSGSANGFFSCCFPWDECLPNGLCFAGSVPSYYTALCTDQTLQDSVCQKRCDGRYRTGVKYNITNDLWACCDKSDRSCSTSTNATFKAPAPDELLRQTMTIVDFIPTSAATAAGSTVKSTGSSSSSVSTSLSNSTTGIGENSTDNSLGIGAVIGISLAVTFFVLAMIAGFAFWFFKFRKTNNRKNHLSALWAKISSTSAKDPGYIELPPYTLVPEKHGVNVVEAPSSSVGPSYSAARYRDDRGLYEMH